MDLGMMLVVLGIVFGTEQIIGYLFIGTGVLLSVISGIKSRRRKDQNLLLRRGKLMKKNVAIDRWQYTALALGISVCLIGALLMVVGEPVLGEIHSGIAAMVSIVGISIIGRFNTTLRKTKAERREA
jgi:hypothetical protein